LRPAPVRAPVLARIPSRQQFDEEMLFPDTEGGLGNRHSSMCVKCVALNAVAVLRPDPRGRL
jgi:hypothetical protein